MATISILMPVYNTEKYLDQTIQSVLNQTFQDWELLCVDDESSDNSWTILLKYAKLDSRIKCFKQKNGGPMNARLLGIKHATGKFFIYLDSDDFYSVDLLEYVYAKAIDSEADSIAPDMYYGGNENLNDYKSFNTINHVNTDEEVSSRQAFIETLPWRKIHSFNLWRKEVFLKSIKKLDITNNFNSDEYLQRVLLLNCNKIVYSKKGIYYHRENKNSITKTLNKRSFKRLDTNKQLIQLGIEYKMDNYTMAKIFGFSFIQLKSLVLDLYTNKTNLSKEDTQWAFSIIANTYKEYTARPLDLSYAKFGKIKTVLQTSNYRFFLLITYLQANLKQRMNYKL